ncbi:cytochrome-c peroxidase [Chitinophaga ginsengisoli]|nr:cytochrome c peroxidase [Chitinophaga ginsengisoli]
MIIQKIDVMCRVAGACTTLLMMLLLGCYGGNQQGQFHSFSIPANFPPPLYRFKNNTITQAGFVLGRKLFYEPRLSRNSTISCGSCHIQSAGFTQHGHDVSHGIDDRLGTRNSPPIMNLAWSATFMWDGGITDLDLQPLAPISNHAEMDNNMENVIRKLKSHPQYPGLFKGAFGTEDITSARVLKALSQFMLMCISSHSKYDSVMRREGGVTFSVEEREGYFIYQQKCAACHAEPLFTDHSFRNNGLSITAVNDVGRYAVTLKPSDRYSFSVPSLRNLAYTAPYMHDGRYLTVAAVLNHYTDLMELTPGLDSLFIREGRPGLTMTQEDKIKLMAFLKTLNDIQFVRDPLLSPQ